MKISRNALKHIRGVPASTPLFYSIFRKYGQNWDIKEKRFCIFARFELLAKSLWCPEQERLDYFLIFISICYFAYYIFYCVQIIHR